MDVLVTGGHGFIGSRLCFLLAAEGHRVSVLDPTDLDGIEGSSFMNRTFQFRKSLVQKAKHISGATTDSLIVDKIFSETQPQLVFHLGMTSSAKEAESEPRKAQAAIVEGTKNLLNSISKQTEKAKIVFASSSMVYGHFGQSLVDETHPLAPINSYGHLKREAEELLERFCLDNDIAYMIARPISVFGPGDDARRVVSKMIVDALTKKEISLSNPELRTDFTYVEDVVEGFLKLGLSSSPINQAYNLSSGVSTSLMDLAKTICQIIPGTGVVVKANDEKPVLRGALANHKVAHDLNHNPQKSLSEGIAESVSYFRKILSE